MELLPCPFCGGTPAIESEGTQIYISCCVSMGLQKSDILTKEENETWREHPYYKYSDDAERKVQNEIINRWNNRYQSSILSDARAALEKYGQHKDSCRENKFYAKPCTCGFKQALDRLKGEATSPC